MRAFIFVYGVLLGLSVGVCAGRIVGYDAGFQDTVRTYQHVLHPEMY